MAVKAKNRKKNKMKELISKSVKIKCEYCELYGNCKTQLNKEKSEQMGIITYCTLTPNKLKKKTKKKKKFRPVNKSAK